MVLHDHEVKKRTNESPLTREQLTNLIIGANRELKGRCIRSALDLIILSAARIRPICGYDIIGQVYQEFKLLLSPGTVYPVLDELERKRFLKSHEDGRRRTYTLTREGTIIASELMSQYSLVESQLVALCSRQE